jgi:hypothetical protein
MSRRVGAALALVLLFVAGSHAFLLTSLPWRAARAGENDAAEYERRLAAVRDQLPPRGRVGYRAEPKSPDWTTAARHFYLTQYGLAPLIVDPSAEGVPVVIDGETSAAVRPPEVP